MNDFQSIENTPFETGLYAFVDGEDVLYIGHTIDYKARIRAHRADKKWMTDSMEILIYPLVPLDARLTLETQLILKYRPLHNKLASIRLRKDGTVYETPWLTPSYRKKRAKSTRKSK